MRRKPKCPRCGSAEFVMRIEEGALVCLRPVKMREDGSYEKCWYHVADEETKPGPAKGKTYHKRTDIILQGKSLIDAIGREKLQKLLASGVLTSRTVRAYNIKLEYSKLINRHKLSGKESLTRLGEDYLLSEEAIKRIIYSEYPKLIETEQE